MAGNAFIVDAARTAIGSLGGSLSTLPAADLAIPVVAALMDKNNLSPGCVEEVILGNVLQAGQGQNVARQVAVGACIPVEKTALTINMVCGSGLRSVADAAMQIQCGNADLIIAGGTECMSKAPYVSTELREGKRLGHTQLLDSLVHDGLWDVYGDCHMGMTAENVADKYGITRQEQDQFAVRSQQKVEAAQAEGRFDDEIVPVLVPRRKKEPIQFKEDQFPRKGVTMESISTLQPAFKPDGGTAGNSSGINDGAACVIVASEEAVNRHGLQPLAQIIAYAWAGVDPGIMGMGPVPATKKVLDKSGWTLADIELVELNEAFAAQSVAVLKELNISEDIVNINGGAIALGHPIGASGCRILVTLLHGMKRQNLSRGLATMCIGGGMGIAMTVELCR